METSLTKIMQWKSEMDGVKERPLSGNPYTGYRYRPDPYKTDAVCNIIKGVPVHKIPRLMEWIERMTGSRATINLTVEHAEQRNESMREWMMREWRVFGDILVNHIDHGDQEVLDMLK